MYFLFFYYIYNIIKESEVTRSENHFVFVERKATSLTTPTLVISTTCIRIFFLESELVAGFFSEHSSTPFVLFFLAEYGSIILMSILCSILFLGGYLLPFNSSIMSYIDNSALEGLIYGVTLGVKTCLLVFTFI